MPGEHGDGGLEADGVGGEGLEGGGGKSRAAADVEGAARLVAGQREAEDFGMNGRTRGGVAGGHVIGGEGIGGH